MKKYLSILMLALSLTSCGAFLGGMSAMYGPSGSYNAYDNLWSSAPTYSSATTVPAALNPATAVENAARSINSNLSSQMSQSWDNAAKEEAVRQQQMKAAANDFWEHPERWVDTGSNGSSVNTTANTTRSTQSTSASGHMCRLCHGSGSKVREIWSGNKTSTKWCSQCQKSVGLGHSHTRCDLCGGDGWCN